MIQYPHIALVSLYDQQESERSFYYRALYNLLAEREPHESISHKVMPTWEEHCAFIEKKAYKEWFLILNKDHLFVGSLYITKLNELGIAIFKDHRRQNYASAAIYNVIEFYPKETFIANINPENQKSIELFKGFGFTHIQSTYIREPVKLDALMIEQAAELEDQGA